jgi:hypothetical protein
MPRTGRPKAELVLSDVESQTLLSWLLNVEELLAERGRPLQRIVPASSGKARWSAFVACSSLRSMGGRRADAMVSAIDP